MPHCRALKAKSLSPRPHAIGNLTDALAQRASLEL
jgi:hypothetical protein